MSTKPARLKIEISIDAETERDAMDAMVKMLEDMSKGHRPICGNGPTPDKPDGFNYSVKYIEPNQVQLKVGDTVRCTALGYSKLLYTVVVAGGSETNSGGGLVKIQRCKEEFWVNRRFLEKAE